MGSGTKVVTTRGERHITTKPLIRGLVFHDSILASACFTITHAESGFSVIDTLPTIEALRAVRKILMRVQWAMSIEDIYDSEPHLTVIEEATAVAGNYRLKFSQAREKEVARDLGGKIQPASGSRPHHKRDILLPEILIEHKTTLPDSLKPDEYRMLDADLEFLRKQAYVSDCIPVYIIEFKGQGGIAIAPEDDVSDVVMAEDVRLLHFDASEKKSFLTTMGLSEQLGTHVFARIKMKTRVWLGMGYLEFLQMVKG